VALGVFLAMCNVERRRRLRAWKVGGRHTAGHLLELTASRVATGLGDRAIDAMFGHDVWTGHARSAVERRKKGKAAHNHDAFELLPTDGLVIIAIGKH
jgi:hypothetical protein